MSDPTSGWAEATSKVSEVALEVTKAGRDASSIFLPILKELVGIATDQLKFVRAKRLIRFSDRFKEFLLDRGLEKPNCDIPFNFLLPLIEQASLEEDDDLQDIWARMLANAADANSQTDRRTAFIRILSDMTILDVVILAKIDELSKTTTHGIVVTHGLPLNADQGNPAAPFPELPTELSISLANLERLGCIESVPGHINQPEFAHARMTKLGSAFILSCTTKT